MAKSSILLGLILMLSIDHELPQSERKALPEHLPLCRHSVSKQKLSLEDRVESEYSRVLREYEDTKAELERCRAVVGQAQIRRMMPCFQELQNRQYNLADRQKRINVLQERIRVAKNSYHQSLRGLDRISTAVHEARKAHAALATKSVDEKLQETLVPRCKSSPELCPEIDHPSEELGTLKNLVCAGESFAFGDPSSVRENVADKCRQEATTPPEVTQS
eukprot:CAMPEP_0169179418 /NCGR_PEP_ID=MMETSP1015-20121227/67624_1 /TAXON_ID=342587 /ORGANISM="Karlodinium micrum, Strain CCMP2283" /LENGTH=218 /DNA_ID=CAMNT_0009254453 /DNA_START=9 /DNA_END=663 /DNA_ORIENTATION=-